MGRVLESVGEEGVRNERDGENESAWAAEVESVGAVDVEVDGARECRGVRCGVRCGDGDALADRDLEGDELL